MRLEAGHFLALTAEILEQGHGLRCRTFGSSMFPLIRSQSRIQIKPVKSDQLRRGDVILYRAGEALVAHRFLRREAGTGNPVLITRGDAFPWRAIERLRPDQVLGQVVAIEWRGGPKLRIDRNPGRRLGILLAKISPLLFPGYLLLSKIKLNLLNLFHKLPISGS